jgi:glycosyltransferase involved in cell wall biosynthesis
MSLTLVIPAYDDATVLERLLVRAARLQLAERVIVVDDGSPTPLRTERLLSASGLPAGALTLLRHDRPRGPGAARNVALPLVETEYLLFLDADDLPTPEIKPLLVDLGRVRFDFCLFCHHDTRLNQERAWGLMPPEAALWRAAGVDLGALSPVSRKAAAELVRTPNYPWNKIYRTDFLRDHGIGCTEILVHEDVELHWRSFLMARHIVASDRVGVVHFLDDDGARLTNRDGPERLEVFGPFARIAAEIAEIGSEGAHYALPFFRFALGLCDWIADHLRVEYHTALAWRVRAFLDGTVPATMLETLRETDPDLIDRIEALARAAGLPGPENAPCPTAHADPEDPPPAPTAPSPSTHRA